MSQTKFTVGVLLAIFLLATQVLGAGAAPTRQDSTPITGNVDSIVVETTVLVTMTDEAGTQTIELSLETAVELGLISLDDTDTPVVNEEIIGTTIEIDPSTVISEKAVGETEEEHPVGAALSDFFSDLLGVDYGAIMDYHDDGVGFGVIAQALWMTNALEGDTDTFALILEAKQTKNFGLITLPDGSEPQNWGQFRKAVMGDREKAKENLGAIMSGRAKKTVDGTLPEQGTDMKSNNGNGVGKSNDGKNNANSTTTFENENNGKNINNGVGNNGNNGNSADNKSKDKSNNGNNKNK